MRVHLPFLVIVIAGLGLVSCQMSPQPIAYGTEACHFCSMTIVDQQHAAQIVTKKGRNYSFDAPECMMNHLKAVETGEVGLFMVNDYESPGVMIDATKATFLISKQIPSPMGEFLSAFGSKDAAENMLSESGGQLYTWEELQAKFKK